MDATRPEIFDDLILRGRFLRPVMTSLNGDNSWLLSFPRPEKELKFSSKLYYHIVFEPWLVGPVSIVSSWLIHITPSQTAAVQTVEAIDKLIGEVEALGMRESGLDVCRLFDGNDTRPKVDAIFLGFHYTDHLHEPTLRLFDPSIPVVATPEAIAILKPWNYFTSIRSISDFPTTATSWQDPTLHPGAPFPAWLTPLRLPGHHELNYITALIWSHPLPSNQDEIVHETLLQSPHGILFPNAPLDAFLASEPPTTKLALLHGLKESRAMRRMNTFGATAGLKLWKEMGGAKYWVLSHTAQLGYAGVVMRVLGVYDTPRTVEWALEQEKAGIEVEEKEGVEGKRRGQEVPEVVEVENGGRFVLA